MSFNRLMYDDCACKQKTSDSTTPMEYQLYKGKFENCNKCSADGAIARDTISYGELVSLENELRNQTDPVSICPSNKHNPSTANKGVAINPPTVCQKRIPACKKEGKGFDSNKPRFCCQ